MNRELSECYPKAPEAKKVSDDRAFSAWSCYTDPSLYSSSAKLRDGLSNRTEHSSSISPLSRQSSECSVESVDGVNLENKNPGFVKSSGCESDSVSDSSNVSNEIERNSPHCTTGNKSDDSNLKSNCDQDIISRVKAKRKMMMRHSMENSGEVKENVKKTYDVLTAESVRHLFGAACKERPPTRSVSLIERVIDHTMPLLPKVSGYSRRHIETEQFKKIYSVVANDIDGESSVRPLKSKETKSENKFNKLRAFKEKGDSSNVKDIVSKVIFQTKIGHRSHRIRTPIKLLTADYAVYDHSS